MVEEDHQYQLMDSSTAVWPAAASGSAKSSSPNAIEIGRKHRPRAAGLGVGLYAARASSSAALIPACNMTTPRWSASIAATWAAATSTTTTTGGTPHRRAAPATCPMTTRARHPYDGHRAGRGCRRLTNQIGVAPGAKWIAAKVFPNGGSSGNEEITPAEDFMLAPWDLNHQNRDPACARTSSPTPGATTNAGIPIAG